MWVNNIFNKILRRKPKTDNNSEFIIQKLQAEIAGLQLLINELKQEHENTKTLLKALEKNASIQMDAELEARFVSFFESLAPILSQLGFQHALFKEDKDVKPANIFKLLKVLEERLTEAGIQRLHNTNEILPFDAQTMLPLKQDLQFGNEDNVRVIFSGYKYKNEYLCKSMVDKAE